MTKLFRVTLFLTAILAASNLYAIQEDLAKVYKSVTEFQPVGKEGQKSFESVDFRFGWDKKSPHKIAIQFLNVGYAVKKFRFSVEDLTSKKKIVVDSAHNARFGNEKLGSVSYGAIWSGTVDSIGDVFSLRVWDAEDNESVIAPIKLKSK